MKVFLRDHRHPAQVYGLAARYNGMCRTVPAGFESQVSSSLSCGKIRSTHIGMVALDGRAWCGPLMTVVSRLFSSVVKLALDVTLTGLGTGLTTLRC